MSKKSESTTRNEPHGAAKVDVAKSTKSAAKESTKASEKKSAGATVGGFMTTNVQTCHSTDDLATAAQKMWSGDCGALPVVDEHGHPTGWVTDRDICMALSMKAARAVDMNVGQVMNKPVVHCTSRDSVKTVLARMAERQIRRIPVVDAGGKIVGVLSMHDLVKAAKTKATATAPAVGDVFDALCEIGKPHPIQIG